MEKISNAEKDEKTTTISLCKSIITPILDSNLNTGINEIISKYENINNNSDLLKVNELYKYRFKNTIFACLTHVKVLKQNTARICGFHALFNLYYATKILNSKSQKEASLCFHKLVDLFTFFY